MNNKLDLMGNIMRFLKDYGNKLAKLKFAANKYK